MGGNSYRYGSCFVTGKNTPGGAGTHTGHTRDTRTHKGTRTAQTNLTTIQTHEQGTTFLPVPVKRHRGEPGHTRTRDKHGTHGQPTLTAIPTHQRTRATARRPNPRPTQRPQPRSRPLLAADSEEAAPCEPGPAASRSTGSRSFSSKLYRYAVNSRVAPCVSQHPRLPPVSFYRNRGPNQRPGVQPGSQGLLYCRLTPTVKRP
jgi:hypothetical protein